jgi:hypothetical protein
MKEIVILSCWPNTEYKENQLLTLIAQLKEIGKEILIATHYPLPDYIIKQVDYYLYDKTNTIYTNKNLNTYKSTQQTTINKARQNNNKNHIQPDKKNTKIAKQRLILVIS